MLTKFLSIMSSLLGNKQKTTHVGAAISQEQANESQPDKSDPLDAMIPDYSIANYVGGNGAEQFKIVGLTMVDWFKAYADLKPNEKEKWPRLSEQNS